MTSPSLVQGEREAFEAWAKPILGDNPTWRESGDCELAWQAWQARASSSTVQQVGTEALDAARYRFLKARLLGVDFDYCESGKTVLMFDWPRSSVSADCDWTVDEAIAASSPKSDGGMGS